MPTTPDDSRADDDGALCSAYLAGDLDPSQVTAFEARLATEPALVALLEGTRTVLEGLHAAGAPAWPDGAGERLRERLSKERSASAAPALLSTARERRSSRRRERPWMGVAAAVALFAVIGGGFLAGILSGGFGGLTAGDGDTAAEGAPDAVAGEDAAEGGGFESFDATDEAAVDDGTQQQDSMAAEEEAAAEDTLDYGQAATEGAAPEPDEALERDEGEDGERAAALSGAGPVLADEGVVLDDADGARAHLEGRADAMDLLGLDLVAAEGLAAEYSAAVREAQPFASGFSPGACIDAVITDFAAPVVVPALVESLTYDGEPALAYVIVTATEDSPVLDRIDAWILAEDSCAALLVLDLSAGG